jgi:hypothetical protein
MADSGRIGWQCPVSSSSLTLEKSWSLFPRAADTFVLLFHLGQCPLPFWTSSCLRGNPERVHSKENEHALDNFCGFVCPVDLRAGNFVHVRRICSHFAGHRGGCAGVPTDFGTPGRLNTAASEHSSPERPSVIRCSATGPVAHCGRVLRFRTPPVRRLDLIWSSDAQRSDR